MKHGLDATIVETACLARNSAELEVAQGFGEVVVVPLWLAGVVCGAEPVLDNGTLEILVVVSFPIKPGYEAAAVALEGKLVEREALVERPANVIVVVEYS